VISIGNDLTQDCGADNPINNLNRCGFAVVHANTSHSQGHGVPCPSLNCPPVNHHAPDFAGSMWALKSENH
jgi:hypothetical protein